MDRARGLSVRWKLTRSYAGFVMLAGTLMLVAAWLAGQDQYSFERMLQYVPGSVLRIAGEILGELHWDAARGPDSRATFRSGPMSDSLSLATLSIPVEDAAELAEVINPMV